MKNYSTFLRRCVRVAFVGDWRYYAWLGALTVLCMLGLNAYAKQFVAGPGATGMSDQVSWGVYIANFTFLVGMAAAAVMMVIPVYIYKNEDLHDLVIFGELLAVAAILMCLAFVTVDLGRPDRFWHLIPGHRRLQFPGSMLSWDVLVLNGYLLLNLHICGYLIYCRYRTAGRPSGSTSRSSSSRIVWAVSIHTITAFLYVGLGGRPFWNSAVLGPRFLASAFTAGPAFIILALQVIRRVTDYRITDRALLTLRSIVQVSMLINVFLLANEVFTEFYTSDLARGLLPVPVPRPARIPCAGAVDLDGDCLQPRRPCPADASASRSLSGSTSPACSASWGSGSRRAWAWSSPGSSPLRWARWWSTAHAERNLVCVGIWAFGFLCYTVFLRMSVPILQGALQSQRRAVGGRRR